MNKYSLSILIISLLQLVIILLISLENGKFSMDIYLGTMGLFYILSIPILFLVGIICIFIEKYRAIGQAALTMIALSLLIGIGLCSGGRIQL